MRYADVMAKFQLLPEPCHSCETIATTPIFNFRIPLPISSTHHDFWCIVQDFFDIVCLCLINTINIFI